MAPPIICLLRGVNVGGNNTLPMATLRSIAADVGLAGATTYLQSGNLIVRPVPASSRSRREDDVGVTLAAGILAATGLTIAVITRTAPEWEQVVARNPFPSAGGSRLHVVFLDRPVGAAFDMFDAVPFAPEEVAVVDGAASREVYLHLPDGIGRAKLPNVLARTATAGGTARNWNTVAALAELVSR
jgi:uncharacterized protein (DUF1697 family)